MSDQGGAAPSGRDCLTPPIFVVLPLCVLVSKGAQEKQRISSVLAGDDPCGSCKLKLGKAGLANPKPPGVNQRHRPGEGKETLTQTPKHLRCSHHSPIFESLSTKLCGENVAFTIREGWGGGGGVRVGNGAWLSKWVVWAVQCGRPGPTAN